MKIIAWDKEGALYRRVIHPFPHWYVGVSGYIEVVMRRDFTVAQTWEEPRISLNMHAKELTANEAAQMATAFKAAAGIARKWAKMREKLNARSAVADSR